MPENLHTIFLEGRIDSNNAQQTEKNILESADKFPDSQIIIDASKLEYISSAGLRVLMKLRKRSSTPLKIINASPEVYSILEVTGFTELFDVKKGLREISVDGCELIGSGGYGRVYRLDPETIVKIYNPEISLAFVEQERNVSQKAFLMGIPTAISYDVVKCGDCYGVVYEMLNAKTTAQIIEKDPAMIPEISGKSAELLKSLHEIIPGPDAGLPDRKQDMRNLFVGAMSEFLTDSESAAINSFLDTIPDRNTFVHGDYNAKNIMVKDGEFQLIDIGSACVGHPVFDIAGLMLVYIFLPTSKGSRFDDKAKRSLLGFDFDLAPKVWNVMCGTYFGLSSQQDIDAVTKKLMPYCYLDMLYHGYLSHGSNRDAARGTVDVVVRKFLLPSLDNVQPLDF